MRKKAVGFPGDLRHARLYHFTDDTIGHIDYLGTVYGGKEKGIAAALQIVSLMLRGEEQPQPIAIRPKRRDPVTRKSPKTRR
jgi:hypothetical protein